MFRTFLTAALLAFVLVSIVFMVIQNVGSARNPTPEERFGEGHVVVVYYFHGNARCETCRRIEKFATEAVTGSLASETLSGNLIFRIVNVDEPAHEHFVSDYKLTTRSVVVVNYVNSRLTDWKNLNRIWDLAEDKVAFKEYVTNEVMAYLKEE